MLFPIRLSFDIAEYVYKGLNTVYGSGFFCLHSVSCRQYKIALLPDACIPDNADDILYLIDDFRNLYIDSLIK